MKRNHFFLLFTLFYSLYWTLTFRDLILPYYKNIVNCETEYTYLLNAYNIKNNIPPGHIDHPGTPIQLLGSLDNYSHISPLKNPEVYLKKWNIFFLISIFSLIAYIIYLTDFPYNLLFTLSPFLFLSFPFILSRAASDIAILIPTLLVLILFLKKNQNPLIWGIICGLGLATKLNFFPHLLLPFIFLPQEKQKFLFFITTIFSFFLFTFPIWNQYPKFLGWAGKLFFYTGEYGSKTEKIFSFKTFFPHLKKFFLWEPLFFAILLIILYLSLKLLLKHTNFKNFAWKKTNIWTLSFALILALTISIFVLAAQIIKGYWTVPLKITGYSTEPFKLYRISPGGNIQFLSSLKGKFSLKLRRGYLHKLLLEKENSHHTIDNLTLKFIKPKKEETFHLQLQDKKTYLTLPPSSSVLPFGKKSYNWKGDLLLLTTFLFYLSSSFIVVYLIFIFILSLELHFRKIEVETYKKELLLLSFTFFVFLSFLGKNFVPRYFAPLYPLALFILYYFFKNLKKPLNSIVFLVFLILTLWNNSNTFQQLKQKIENYNNHLEKLYTHLQKLKNKKNTLIFYEGAPVKEWNLWIANSYTFFHYSNTLEKLYPHCLFFIESENKIVDFNNQPQPLPEKAFLIGKELSPKKIKSLNLQTYFSIPGYRFQKIVIYSHKN